MSAAPNEESKGDAEGAQPPRPALPLARLRPAGELEPGPSLEALDRWRPIRPGELGAALSPPSLDGPRGAVADRQTRGRWLPHHPSAVPGRPMGTRTRQDLGRLGLSGGLREGRHRPLLPLSVDMLVGRPQRP